MYYKFYQFNPVETQYFASLFHQKKYQNSNFSHKNHTNLRLFFIQNHVLQHKVYKITISQHTESQLKIKFT